VTEHGAIARGDVEIAWDVRGAGPWLALLMGLGGRAADWSEPFTDRLATRFRVLRIDNRGAGRSSKPPGPYELGELARDAIAALDAVGAIHAHLLGFSMGGMIAQLLAIDHGARVDRLVLLSTHEGGAAVVQPSDETMKAMAGRGRDARGVVRRRVSAIAAPGWAEAHPETVERIVDLALDAPMPMHAFLSQAQAVLQSDRSTRVPGIEHPTLVVHGAVDPLVPVENGRRLARAIPGARLHELAGVGHLPMWEAPETLAEVVEGFLGEGGGASLLVPQAAQSNSPS
jgi:pimeloyl-ACP methyl ester carboxylesterase